jgi:hypothetical protein
MRRIFLIGIQICAVISLAGATVNVCSAQEIRIPASAGAGDEATVSTTGSGKATFYLLGPGVSLKSDVSLGEEIHLAGQELKNAGDYLVLVCSSTCRSANFYVTAAKPASLTFLVHPSRVPVSQGDAVSGVALPFDKFHNLVLTPVTVNFQLTAGTASLFSRQVRTQDGAAWFRTASGKSAGAVQAVASLDDLSARRAVQQVASDPCNLRIKGQRTAAGILVETEPVHDCAGNVVSDGTIVTFTATEGNRRCTVDAPIKKGVARALMTEPDAAVISVASGVVMGNELRIGAKP